MSVWASASACTRAFSSAPFSIAFSNPCSSLTDERQQLYFSRNEQRRFGVILRDQFPITLFERFSNEWLGRARLTSLSAREFTAEAQAFVVQRIIAEVPPVLN
jgi:hypothetical protein